MSEPAIENIPQPIPDKLYFRIGEVSRLVGVPHHVLRYWESEFHSLGPKKSGKGHRLYRRKDVELLLEIKHLLYEKRFTIEGARARLRELGHDEEPAPLPPPPPSEVSSETLRKIRQGLADLIRICEE